MSLSIIKSKWHLQILSACPVSVKAPFCISVSFSRLVYTHTGIHGAVGTGERERDSPCTHTDPYLFLKIKEIIMA